MNKFTHISISFVVLLVLHYAVTLILLCYGKQSTAYILSQLFDKWAPVMLALAAVALVIGIWKKK